MGQWSELPGDLLDIIDGHLNCYNYKLRVRAVCVSWNSYLPKVRIPLPRLLQAFETKSGPTHRLYNLLDKKFDLLDLPELQSKLFKGSSYGWVVATDDSPGKTSPDIFLINPETKVKIELPPRYTFPDVIEYNVDRVDEEYTFFRQDENRLVPSSFVHLHLMEKVVLSLPPSSEDCVVVAIYGEFGSLAWCKCNDKTWTSLQSNFGPERRAPYLDILFYKGRLHALNFDEIMVFEDIGGPRHKLLHMLQIPKHQFDFAYLVESSDGELLMAERDINLGELVIDSYNEESSDDKESSDEELDSYYEEPSKNIREIQDYIVYKFDSINSSWSLVENIGDDMLFLGLNLSLSISARKFLGCKGNRIYFTEQTYVFLSKEEKIEDSVIGIFNLEDRSVESFPGFKCDPRFLWPPPIWV